MKITLQEAAALLLAHDRYCIYTHRRPDGDTLGSAAALCHALRSVGKTAYVAPNAELTPRYAFLTAALQPPADFVASYALVCDTASVKQLSVEGLAAWEANPDAFLLSIDHHASNSGFINNTHVQPGCAACGEVVFQLLAPLSAPLTVDIARAIYVAVATDTGCFRYANTTADSLAIASVVSALPIDLAKLNYTLFIEKSRQRITLERQLLQHLRFFCGGAVCSMRLTLGMLQESGAEQDDLDSMAGLPRSIQGVVCGLFLREEADGCIKVSARSSERLNVSDLCAQFGGGGHARAAGCTVAGQTIAQVEEAFVAAIETLLRE